MEHPAQVPLAGAEQEVLRTGAGRGPPALQMQAGQAGQAGQVVTSGTHPVPSTNAYPPGQVVTSRGTHTFPTSGAQSGHWGQWAHWIGGTPAVVAPPLELGPATARDCPLAYPISPRSAMVTRPTRTRDSFSSMAVGLYQRIPLACVAWSSVKSAWERLLGHHRRRQNPAGWLPTRIPAAAARAMKPATGRLPWPPHRLGINRAGTRSDALTRNGNGVMSPLGDVANVPWVAHPRFSASARSSLGFKGKRRHRRRHSNTGGCHVARSRSHSRVGLDLGVRSLPRGFCRDSRPGGARDRQLGAAPGPRSQDRLTSAFPHRPT